MLPEAHIIHVIEDPREIVAQRKTLKSITLKEVEDISSSWLVALVETKQQAQFCSHYMEVKSNEIIEDPFYQGKRILEFLKVEVSREKPGTQVEQYLDLKQEQANTNGTRSLLNQEENALIESITGQTLYDIGLDN